MFAWERQFRRRIKKFSMTLAQAIPKAGKMDLIVKTAAELGTDVIIPFTAARSVSRIEGEKASAKVARWQKIVQEAARCSRSPQVAAIEPVLSFADMLLQGNARRPETDFLGRRRSTKHQGCVK